MATYDGDSLSICHYIWLTAMTAVVVIMVVLRESSIYAPARGEEYKTV